MLTICDLDKNYGGLPVLKQLSLAVDDGEIVAVVGPSGCGKSTLLNIVAGFIHGDAGTVDADGARLGYVFQEDRLLPWRTVFENIALVRNEYKLSEVERWLECVGLAGFAAYYPDELSGGMRQRCSIARAYHYDCDLLLMDEPFKSLDHNLRFEMLAVLMKVRRERRNAVLFVTHDIEEALAISSRVLVFGKRPATVVREFRFGATDELRNVTSLEFLTIKREIIDLLL